MGPEMGLSDPGCEAELPSLENTSGAVLNHPSFRACTKTSSLVNVAVGHTASLLDRGTVMNARDRGAKYDPSNCEICRILNCSQPKHRLLLNE